MPPSRPGRPGRTVFAVLAVAAAALGLAACSSGSGSLDDDLIGDSGVGLDPDCPARGHVARDVDGRIRPDTPEPSNFSFLYVGADGCTPLRFNPCEPIRYVTNETNARPADLEALTEALRRVTAATGLEFVHEGPTDETPGRRPPYLARYGDRWAPVLVAWVDNAAMARFVAGATRETAQSTGTTIPVSSYPGGGTPVPVDSGGIQGLVSGLLILNVDATDPSDGRPIDHGFGPGLNWGRVLLHEIGHLIGLGHVSSRSNLMQHELRLHTLPNADWGVGDLLALKAIGREAGCTETPPFNARARIVPAIPR